MRICVVMVVLLLSPLVSAKIFTCTNHSGAKIFTDNQRDCANADSYSTVKIKSGNSSSTDFHTEIPDLLQTKESAGFPGGGKQFCGPVAVSNSLAWLSGNVSEADQIALVHKLGSQNYMNTNTKDGTGTTGLIRGIVRYVEEEFGGYRTIQYSGWRKVPKKYRLNTGAPTLAFIKSGLNRHGSVWLNVGWYDYSEPMNEYTRVGGHWVTLVGYRDGKLLIHDPASRAGRSSSTEYVGFTPLTSGKLVGKKSGLPRNSYGFLNLDKGMHKPSKATNAIIDGAVVLQLKR